jgi:hypothetical protein
MLNNTYKYNYWESDENRDEAKTTIDRPNTIELNTQNPEKGR